MTPVNPYQDVIDWLRSPEGETWSEARIRQAAVVNGNSGHTCTRYGTRGDLWMGGMFSVKEDTCDAS